MSIINDALKKAERDRARIPVGIPTLLAVPRMTRQWIRIAIAGALLAATIGGGVGVWRWLLSEPGHIDRERQARQPVASVAHPVQPLAQGTIPEPRGAPPSPPWSHAAPEAAFQKAVTAESAGAWGEAMRYYQEAIALRPTLREAHTNLGNLYVRQNQLTAAIEQFQAALALEPNYALARNNLGSTYLMMGHEAMAVGEFLAAIRSDAQYVSPYYNLGSLYARRGDVDQAISFLTKAITLEPAVLTWLQQDPDFDRIRATREFQRLHAQAVRQVLKSP